MNRFVCVLLAVVGFGQATLLRADPGPLVLWYTNAAVSWQQEALPVGNGKLAAMVFGNVTNDEIQFNEETIWTGQPHFYENSNATPANLATIRNKVFNGQALASSELNSFMSVPLRQAMYEPPGSLRLAFPHPDAGNYRRWLDLDTATAGLTYTHDGTTYYRDVFASAPANVIVIRLTADQPGRISLVCNFTSPQTNTTVSATNNDLILHGRVSAVPRPEYFATGLTNLIEYEARLRVLAEGGSVSATGDSVSVSNADAVTLLLSVASSFVKYDDLSGNPSQICSNHLAAAATNTFAQLRQAQLDDHRALFRRVVLDLGATAKTNFPTGYRVRRIGDGDDPQLSTLYFQLGRYLMICGSRPGSQPLTLQGKWNETTNPSWESKMTLNINEQLNYAGAEVCNLSECHEPLFDLIADLAVTGARVAQTNYNARGWVVHHNTDLWRGAAPINGVDGIWPTGNAWLCQNLWAHYEFTGDTNFLAQTAYPLMKGAAQFFEDFLVPHVTNSNWLVTNPSYSPEHNHPWSGVANVPGPTTDNELLRDLFNNVIQATEVLGVDAAFRTNVMNLLSRLPPPRIGRLGQLQEWLEDADSPGDTHRHCSHLVGLWPGETISPFYTATLAAAAKVSTDIRGNGDIGWGKAWRVNLRARLLDGERAYFILTNMIADNKCTTNLMFHDQPNRQVDAIFGAMNGMAELFLQSQRGEVFLLPALPSKWTNGSVSGLCARGGFEVNILWQSNRLASATILSKLGNPCRVRSKWPIEVKQGSNYLDAPMVQPGLWQFSTTAGSTYSIVPANIRETELLSASTSTGDSHQVTTNLAFSNLRGTRLNANAALDFVTYTVTNLAAGSYRIRIVADAGVNRGKFQLACGPAGGTLTNVGQVQDTFSSTNVFYLLATNSPPTNYFATNMLVELDCGTWQAVSNGNYSFQFQVAGRNPASVGYTLAFDYIRLTPTSLSPIEQWRAVHFGADAGDPAIAGDPADPDLDGTPNLLEYAFGRNPLVAEVTNPVTVDISSGHLALTYHRAKAATDVTFVVEVKSDLDAAWTTGVQPSVITDDGNGITDTVRVEDATSTSAPHRFMRLRVTRP